MTEMHFVAASTFLLIVLCLLRIINGLILPIQINNTYSAKSFVKH